MNTPPPTAGRRPVDREVVRRVKFLSRIVAGESGLARFVRGFMFPMALKVPFLRTRMLATVAGLDHELPDLTPKRKLTTVSGAA